MGEGWGEGVEWVGKGVVGGGWERTHGDYRKCHVSFPFRKHDHNLAILASHS